MILYWKYAHTDKIKVNEAEPKEGVHTSVERVAAEENNVIKILEAMCCALARDWGQSFEAVCVRLIISHAQR